LAVPVRLGIIPAAVETIRTRMPNGPEKYLARFGFVPNEKDDTPGEIPPGYVNLTELKLKVYDAWKKEKALEEKESN
jgi:hypothetical protein